MTVPIRGRESAGDPALSRLSVRRWPARVWGGLIVTTVLCLFALGQFMLDQQRNEELKRRVGVWQPADAAVVGTDCRSNQTIIYGYTIAGRSYQGQAKAGGEYGPCDQLRGGETVKIWIDPMTPSHSMMFDPKDRIHTPLTLMVLPLITLLSGTIMGVMIGTFGLQTSTLGDESRSQQLTPLWSRIKSTTFRHGSMRHRRSRSPSDPNDRPSHA
jgi:hypothetical protein